MSQKAEKLRQQKQKQLDLDIESVMKTDSGRRFVRSIMITCRTNKSSADESNYRTNETFFHEGRRSIGVDVEITLKRVCPELFNKMMIEDLTND